MKSPCPSFMPGFDGSAWNYKYDLDMAKKLLAEAGQKDGFSFDFVLGSGFSDWEQDAVLIQASFAKIGVKMNIQKMPAPSSCRSSRRRKPLRSCQSGRRS